MHRSLAQVRFQLELVHSQLIVCSNYVPLLVNLLHLKLDPFIMDEFIPRLRIFFVIQRLLRN